MYIYVRKQIETSQFEWNMVRPPQFSDKSIAINLQEAIRDESNDWRFNNDNELTPIQSAEFVRQSSHSPLVIMKAMRFVFEWSVINVWW